MPNDLFFFAPPAGVTYYVLSFSDFFKSRCMKRGVKKHDCSICSGSQIFEVTQVKAANGSRPVRFVCQTCYTICSPDFGMILVYGR